MTPQEEIDRLKHAVCDICGEQSSTVVKGCALCGSVCEACLSECNESAGKQSQLSTALAEALALRLEVERLRDGLRLVENTIECAHPNCAYPDCPSNEPHKASIANGIATVTLSQPTTTNLTDKLLRLVVDTLRHIKGIEQWSTVQNTAAALTPEEVNLIEVILK